MSVLRVTSITRDEMNADRMIAGIGGDGFYHTIDEAIDHIDSRTHQYWVEVEDGSAWVEVGYRPDGTSFLKTQNEDFPPDKLLSLAEHEFTESSSINEDSPAAIAAMVGLDRAPHLGLAEQMALKTAVRLLVLDQFGRREGRLETMRERAIQRASGAVEHMDLDEDARRQLQEALTRQFDSLFALPAER